MVNQLQVFSLVIFSDLGPLHFAMEVKLGLLCRDRGADGFDIIRTDERTSVEVREVGAFRNGLVTVKNVLSRSD